MYFEVHTKTTARADHRNSVTIPKQYPCLELVHNYDWEDSGYANWFCLWYCQEGQLPIQIGDVKIMTLQKTATIDALEPSFEKLDNSFCSLGLNLRYYQNIKDNFVRSEWIEILKALRDCTTNKIIYETFRYEHEFTESLWREMTSQEAFKYGTIILNNRKLEDAYSFVYTCKVPSAENEITLRANFPYECSSYKRTMGIIGENGMGKTQLLSKLSESLAKGNIDNFKAGLVPLFDECLVLSSTPYDSYQRGFPNALISYLYKSLEQREDNLPKSLSQAILDIANRRTRVRFRSLYNWYREILTDTIGDVLEHVVSETNIPDFDEDAEVYYTVDANELSAVLHQLSSGHFHLFLLITYIFQHIHYSTLVIVDEPEVHLHPHTIVQFMRVLSQILNLFNSYAIIATHSPLIIREMISTNVQVLRTVEGGLLMLNPVAYNTFGEDITTLYYNIFNYDIKDSVFASVIDEKISKGGTYADIIEELEPDVDLSLNARMTIRDLVEESKNRKDEAF